MPAADVGQAERYHRGASAMGRKIEDYALIGDGETAALIERSGSIDWLCWPRFDSAACFAALLGTPANGRWLIAPADGGAAVARRYKKQTLIVETEFETGSGAATVVDFMPLRTSASHVIRLVVGRRGTVRMRVELIIRPDYGSIVPWVTRLEGGGFRAIAGADMIVLRTPVPLHGEDLKTLGEFTVAAGQTVPFVLTYGASHMQVSEPIDPQEACAATSTFWQEWCSGIRYAGKWSDAVIRSLITLKGLIYRPTGAIVAAPTTSLPELIGGSRNWDYRFCWIRDATFALLALMNAGYYDEARAWRGWLLRAVAGTTSQMQIMYGLMGERRLDERELPWLPGFESSRPVRIGNAAAKQLQVDIFGEVMDVLYHARNGKLAPSEAGWDLQREFLKHLETIWERPGAGIWEMRGQARQFVTSKVMAWVAFDRAVKSVEECGLGGAVDRWRALRRQIHDEVCRRGFDPEVGAFVQHYGSSKLDASALLIPLVGFLPASDPRVHSTVRAIERRLTRDGLVLRYETAGGMGDSSEGEGAFLACCFWLADVMILQGRREEACRLFERLLLLRNDVGLLSEEYDPASEQLVGNFPQALSHIALINTAHNLSEAVKPAEQRSGSQALEAQGRSRAE
jgi:GH15 family glucan-1,4-alpha-glucosidase